MELRTTTKKSAAGVPAMPGGALEHVLRLDEPMVALLDELDKAEGTAGQGGGGAQRFAFRRGEQRLLVTHPGGGTAERSVVTRDLSVNGISLIHSGFLYTGTACEMTLKRRSGGQDVLQGHIKSCRHVHGTYHLVGVQFDTNITPRHYVDPAVWAEANKGMTIDPATLKGQVLMIDDQKLDHAMAAHCLRGTAVKLVGVRCAAEAIAAHREGKVDVILCDLNLDKERGEQVIVKLREAGYRGPILVVSAESNAERIGAAWSAGASAILSKPYSRQDFLGALGQALASVGGESGGETIYSTLLDGTPDGDAVSFVTQYVEEVQEKLNALKAGINADDVEGIRLICQNLKGTGANFGFPDVTTVAKQAVRALDASGSIDESLEDIRRLESICRRLSSSPRQ